MFTDFSMVFHALCPWVHIATMILLKVGVNKPTVALSHLSTEP